jgi:protein SCO1
MTVLESQSVSIPTAPAAPVGTGWSRRLMILLPVAIILLGGVFWITYLLGSGMRFGPKYGMVLQSPEPAMDFRLPSHLGQEMALSDFRGEIVLLYFGYTVCPDVCPTTLAEVHKALDLLGDEADKVTLIMVSVDPERDTPEVLAEYLPHFDSRFVGLVGSPEQTLEIATNYGIHYERRDSDSALGYLVDHTATLTLIDRDGHARLIFPYGTKAEELAEDIRYVLHR